MTKTFDFDSGILVPDATIVRVRVLPDGRMSAADSAAYLGCSAKTLASRRSQGAGPVWTKVCGRIFYFKADLDSFIAVGKSHKPPKGKAK